MIAAQINIVGAEEVAARLRDMGPQIQAAVVGAMKTWGSELTAYIHESKLSGDPLHQRSGDLKRAVVAYFNEEGSTVEGGSKVRSGIPYAHIHEYGGTITAKNAPYLTFKTLDGRWHRVKSVVMPERSYMRTSFREQAQEGIAEIRAAVQAAVLA